MTTQLRTLRLQAAKLRRLSQPYFLPYTEDNGWQFFGLLVCLLFCVAGLVLFLLTGLMNALFWLMPDLTQIYLGGVQSSLSLLWRSGWGGAITVLFGIGTVVFASVRSQLRHRRWLPWLFLGVIILMLLSVNGINAGITFIARDLTNALIAKDGEASFRNLWVYGACFAAALPIRSLQFYFTQKLGLLWREWLSLSLVDDYLTDRAYYILNPNDEAATNVDNPNQRISEDARDFTAQTLGFTLSIFDSILTFFLNILILFSVSESLTFALLAYASLISLLMIVAGRKLVRLNNFQLRYEADFRYGLVRVRDNAESIAFYSGEGQESKEINRRLRTVVENFNLLIIWEVLLRVLQRSSIYASNFIPYLILAAPILSGEMDYGGFAQANVAYNLVEGSLFFIIYNIEALARFSASINRLEGFQSNISSIDSDEWSDFLPNVEPSSQLAVHDITVRTPRTDNVLIRDLSFSLEPAHGLLVVGPSGCGKTSLLRVVSGLWGSPTGRVLSPDTGELLFIPQKPYMALGSLREQLCYPLDQARFSDEQLRSVLEKVMLPKLLERYPDFDIKQDWPRLLSLGEQQRLAFARLLLNSPKVVVLDEATSALDVDTEMRLYALLRERDIAFISVGHRPTLKAFHDSVLDLSGDGGWRLIPATSYDFGQA